MNNAISTKNVSTCLENEIAPMPSVIPGEFMVRLGEGWGGNLHDLADGLAEWELGAEAALYTLRDVPGYIKDDLVASLYNGSCDGTPLPVEYKHHLARRGRILSHSPSNINILFGGARICSVSSPSAITAYLAMHALYH